MIISYLHVYFQILGRTWTLEHFKHHISQTYGKEAASVAFNNLESAIVETLLLTEGATYKPAPPGGQHPNPSGGRCTHCSQLLGFDLVFNSSFHPLVVEVRNSSHT